MNRKGLKLIVVLMSVIFVVGITGINASAETTIPGEWICSDTGL